jgi:hypothetical protein
MNSPRIRHFVQPPMSVVDRNLAVTNEVRTIMTTTALPLHTTRQRGLELLISRLAVSMLRWSQQRTERRATRRPVTHEQMMLLRALEVSRATAPDLARLSKLG